MSKSRRYNRLESWAMDESRSRGRKYPEQEHPYRNMFARDRDRIVHCSAFRRLEYKTQVFVNHEGDHYRTRLTHTLEVSQISRSIARELGLHEDLVEAVALGHDLGHTPFGHSGEKALQELLAGSGGFEHNEHSLRVVDELEDRYPEFPGLNLTHEVREGILKHTDVIHADRFSELEPDVPSTLEAQCVDLADEIAYMNHDLDDGMRAHILGGRDLAKVSLWEETSRQIRHRYSSLDAKKRRFLTIRSLINILVTNSITETRRRITRNKIKTVQDVRAHGTLLVGYSRSLDQRRLELKLYLEEKLYRDHHFLRLEAKAMMFVRRLFAAYRENPMLLPIKVQARARTRGLVRVITDYIAGMTDRFVHNEFRSLFEA